MKTTFTKRMLSLTIVFAMIIAMVAVAPAASAAGNPSLTFGIDAYEYSTGGNDYVRASIYLIGYYNWENPINNMDLRMHFDTAKLTYTGSNAGAGSYKAFTTLPGMTVTSSTGTSGVSAANTRGYAVYVLDTGAVEDEDTGDEIYNAIPQASSATEKVYLRTYQFTINEGATGDCSFYFDATKVYVTNFEGETPINIITGSLREGDTALTAVYTIPSAEITISYNANGGSGNMDATTAAAPVVAACAFTAPGGKMFDKWNTAADGTGTDYAVGATAEADVTLYAIWKDVPPTEYTLTFDANGGSGNMDSITAVGPVVPACTFTAPAGKHFAYWNTSADGKGTTYAQSAVVAANITLYAIWEADTVTIYYKDNGGSGEMDATVGTTENYPVVAACAFTAPKDKIFDKWNTKEDGTGTDYAVGATAEADVTLYAIWKDVPAGERTLTIKAVADKTTAAPGEEIKVTVSLDGYAAWDIGFDNAQFWMWFDNENLTYVGSSLGSFKVPNGATVTRSQGNSGIATANERGRVVWMYDAAAAEDDETGEPYANIAPFDTTVICVYTFKVNEDAKPGTYEFKIDSKLDFIFRNVFEDVYLANKPSGMPESWTLVPASVKVELPPIVITYDANGGEGEMNETSGRPVAVAENLFTRKHYEFIGWNTSADGTGTAYKAGDEIETSVTLYAQWKAKVYTVTYVANGGIGEMENTVGTGAPAVVATCTLTAPEGHSFAGWNTSADGKGDFVAAGTEYTEDVTLYAIWAAEPVTVHYNANGGEGEMDSVVGLAVTVSENIFTRKHYVFAGWNTAADGSGVAYEAGQTIAMNATLYAQWEAKIYTIVYDANGGEGEMENTVGTGAPAVVVANGFTAPEGYDFKGWNTSADGKGAFVAVGTEFEEDVTLYAIWSADPFTITYNPNGAEGEAIEIIVDRGETFVVAENTYAIPQGKIFVCWKDEAGNVYKPGDIVESKEVTLYAIWVSPYESFTVTFNYKNAAGEEVTKTYTVSAGDDASALITELELYGFIFEGWDADLSCITEDITVNAVWSEDPNVVTPPPTGVNNTFIVWLTVIATVSLAGACTLVYLKKRTAR